MAEGDNRMPDDARGKKALVIGATGGAGHAVAVALRRHGWRIRAMHRDPERAQSSMRDAPIDEWVRGDAIGEADVCAAADGASLIFHGANPPGYKRWRDSRSLCSPTRLRLQRQAARDLSSRATSTTSGQTQAE